MDLVRPQRRFDELRPEMVDRPDADPVLLEGELRNLRIINRYLGGHYAVRRALLAMLGETDPASTVEILDLATGSGDQPVAIARALRRCGRRAMITAVDRNELVLRDARRHAAGVEGIRFERGDIRSCGFPDRSFDIVLCSLAIHHFTWPAAVRLLREMHRLSRIGFIVSDLSRSYLALAGAWVYTRLTTRNIMTHADAVASIFAAFTEEELRRMADEANVSPVEITRTPMFRLTMVKTNLR